VRAVSLTSIGARGEGLAELEDVRKKLKPEIWNYVTTSLLQYYSKSYAQSKTQDLTKELQKAQEEALKSNKSDSKSKTSSK